MKKQHFLVLALSSLMIMGCKNTTDGIDATIVEKQLCFNEGNTFDGDNLLISNFGGTELNPMNQNHLGYILSYAGDSTRQVIVSDSLNAPKGMAVKDGYLYIADVSVVWVYSLDSVAKTPIRINFPEGNQFVNDIAIRENTAYVSVTNSGKIFKLDISSPETLCADSLQEFVHVSGANGLEFVGDVLYVASYPADGKTTADNVIYKIADMTSPVPEKIITLSGQYDGLVHSEKTNRLYFTNWIGGQVGYVDLANNNNIVPLTIKNYTFAGPADMSFCNGKLYVCDLGNSKLVILPVE